MPRLRFSRAPCKCWLSCGCETHAGILSFRPEVVEVAGEVTNRREPSMSKGCYRQLSELAGHNVSERRAGPENVSRESRPSG